MQFFFRSISTFLRRHRCPHGPENDDVFTNETTTTVETSSAYRKDFIDKKVTSFDSVRTPMKKPVDNLKPEGVMEFKPKDTFKPAEKVIATKPQDNLFVSGEFNGNFTNEC